MNTNFALLARFESPFVQLKGLVAVKPTFILLNTPANSPTS